MERDFLSSSGNLRRALDALPHSFRILAFEWYLTAFAAGIGVYFAWPGHPQYVAALLGLCGIAVLAFTLRRSAKFAHLSLALFFMAFGFYWTAQHVRSVNAPILPAYQRVYEVSGWLEDIGSSGNFQHFYIRVDSITGLDINKTPRKVRIRTKPHSILPGDAVRMKAVLTAPQAPVMTFGYDGARAAYFNQIGGTGFAISAPEMTALAPRSFRQRMRLAITHMRYGLSRHIQLRAPPHTGGLQAALLTGDRSAIPKAQETSLRDAGLAHLLAISGLHMGLLAGGAYALFSYGFSMIGPLARRYDMRKAAAVIGAVFSIGYLIISGASVSTQRAFIMAIVIFAAIILGRRALSMRSVAVAAALTLALHPESLLSAGFQMSFSATAALVAVYRGWADWKERQELPPQSRSLITRLKTGFSGLAVTSFVAGLATGVFAALHFHRFARYGFAANLAAMPLFTFIAMPAGFLGVILIPIGLDGVMFKIMGLGLDGVLAVSDWISAMDGALLYIHRANSLVVSVFALGFTALCLGPNLIRALGGLLIVISFGMWANVQTPDMRISEDGRIAFWDPSNAKILRVDSARADSFGRSRFAEQSGQGQAEIESYLSRAYQERTDEDKAALCDFTACRILLSGKVISVLIYPEEIRQACLDSDLVILSKRTAGPVIRRQCRAVLIDAEDLAQNGAYEVIIPKTAASRGSANDKIGAITLQPANPKSRRARPWG